MAYFYIKNGGSATGDAGRYTSAQTGSFATLGAANYYGSVASAVAATTSPTHGDILCVSDSHSETPSDTTFTAGGGGYGQNYLHIWSVSDTAMDSISAASSAQFNPVDDILLQGSCEFIGCYLKPSDDMQVGNANYHPVFDRCTIEVPNAGDVALNMLFDACSATLKDTDVSAPTATSYLFRVSGGSRVQMFGGSATGDALIYGTGLNGGMSLLCVGVDLTGISDYLLAAFGGANNIDDTCVFDVKGCELDSGLTGLVQETLSQQHHRVNIFNSAATSAAAEYQFHIEALGGYVDDQDDAGIHRDESTAFPSGTKVSAHCVTDANSTRQYPFWFELPARYAELSSASTDTIRVYVASTASLTDLDVWVDVYYPDGTNKHHYNSASSKNLDPFDATGTALTTDSGSTWKDGVSNLTGYNEYYIDVDTSGDVGADGVPEIVINVAKASTTIYFDTTIDVVA